MPEKLRFDGRVAFITGATSGLGLAYCRLLASRGAKVVVNGNYRPEGVGPEQQIAAEIRAQGGEAIGLNGSVLDDIAIERMIGETIATYGRLDILINNAGVGVMMDILKPDDTLHEQFKIHTVAPIRVTRSAWKHLAASGTGRIINTLSSAAYGSAGENFWEGAYGTTKATVFTFTRQMAGAGAPVGIRVNAVIPWGYSRTVEQHSRDTEFGRWMRANTPAEKVAAVVCYLAHTDCKATGQFFTAAGGRVNRVMFASTRGYFNRDLAPEDVKANFDNVCGRSEPGGYYSDLLDLTSVEREWMEHQSYLDAKI